MFFGAFSRFSLPIDSDPNVDIFIGRRLFIARVLTDGGNEENAVAPFANVSAET